MSVTVHSSKFKLVNDKPLSKRYNLREILLLFPVEQVSLPQ